VAFGLVDDVEDGVAHCGYPDLHMAAEKAAVAAEDLVAVDRGVDAEYVGVVEEARLLGAFVGRRQWCDKVVS